MQSSGVKLSGSRFAVAIAMISQGAFDLAAPLSAASQIVWLADCLSLQCCDESGEPGGDSQLCLLAALQALSDKFTRIVLHFWWQGLFPYFLWYLMYCLLVWFVLQTIS